MKLKLVGTTLLKINERKIGNEGIGYIDILDLMLIIYRIKMPNLPGIHSYWLVEYGLTKENKILGKGEPNQTIRF